MAQDLSGLTVAILVANGFEQVEMTEPRKALNDAGARTVLISPEQGRIQGMNHDQRGDTFPVETSLDTAAEADFDALLLVIHEGDDTSRLADLNAAIRDPRIDGIWCLRGGYGTMRILDAVDYDSLRRKPKAVIEIGRAHV